MTEIRELSNGIRVVLEPCSHFHSVSFGVWIKTGSRNETKENNGIAHMTEHMLFKGTKTRTAEDIAGITARLGGNLNAYTSKECTSYYCKTLPELLPEAVSVIGDMICNSLVGEEELEHEKAVVCDEIDMYDDSAEDYVHEVLQKKIYRHHPLGFLISGKKKVVKAFSSEEIHSFIRRYYTGGNMVISVAGRFDPEKTMEMIEKMFCAVTPSERQEKTDTPEYTRAVFTKYKDIEQLHMNMAFPAPSFLDKERYAITLLNNILGGDVNSRLFQEIREKRGLTYNVCSYGSAFSDTGLLHIYAAMNPSQEKLYQSLVEQIVAELADRGIREKELEESIQQTVVEMTLGQDNSAGRMNSNAKAVMFQEELLPFEETIQRIKAVSLEEVNAAARKYLQPDMASLGIVKAKHGK